MNSLFIPWDFLLILAVLGTYIPWRGASRMKRLLSKPELTTRDRLSLYGSTILFQWLLVAIVALRCALRSVEPEELGLTLGDPWRVAWTTIGLTGVLCFTQIVGLTKMLELPEGRRGLTFSILQRIMPRTRTEAYAYTGLAGTAGFSEEFLYRGFVYMAFVRMIVNYATPSIFAVILSSIWFAVAHAYQGRRGIFTTFVVGMIFGFVRLWTGSLLPVAIAHFGIDLTVGILVFSRLSKT